MAHSDRGFLHALQRGTACIQVAGERIEGNELSLRVGAVARAVEGARRVAVTAAPTVDTLVAVAGILLGGGTAVPINHAASAAEREYILLDSAADLILDTLDPHARAPLPADLPADDSPALILYTSGSTGSPKGVVVPRRAIAENLDALAQVWEWSAEDVLAHALPFFHVHGLVFGGLGPLRIGSPLIHTGRYFEPVRNATLYFGVSTFWASLPAEDLRAMRSARLLISGAGVLPEPVFARVQATTGHQLLNRYAMTETLALTSPTLHGIRAARSVGPPLPGVEMRIVACDEHSIGAIEVRGKSLFLGYLGRESPFSPDGWFRTGDLGRWNQRGELELLGRKDTDLIKCAGYRVGAGEVEEVLLSFPGVREAAVTGIPDEILGQRIAGWLVCSQPPDRIALLAHIESHLVSYKRPSELHFPAALPRNALGKVQKHLLLKLREP